MERKRERSDSPTDRKRRRHHHSSKRRGDDSESHHRDRDRHHHRRHSKEKDGHRSSKHRDDDHHRRRHHSRHHSSRRSSSSSNPSNSTTTTSSSSAAATGVPLPPPSPSPSQVPPPVPPLPPLPLDPNGSSLPPNTTVRPADPAYFEQMLPAAGADESLLTDPTTVLELPEEKHVPSFSLSGALAQDETTGNMINGVVLKYSEPVEARLPTRMWRLYVFKNGEQVDVYHIHRQSYFLFGRDRTVVHVPVDHPSSSSQHAVIQYRLVNGSVTPYVIDIESTNGTWLNGTKLESARYYELNGSDMIKFGTSVREYVLVDAGEKKDD